MKCCGSGVGRADRTGGCGREPLMAEAAQMRAASQPKKVHPRKMVVSQMEDASGWLRLLAMMPAEAK